MSKLEIIFFFSYIISWGISFKMILNLSGIVETKVKSFESDILAHQFEISALADQFRRLREEMKNSKGVSLNDIQGG